MPIADDQSGTILVIDDTPTNLQVVSAFLEEAGYRVLVAEDGNDAKDIPDLTTFKFLEDVERDHILRAVKMTKWRISDSKGVAELLGFNRSTFRPYEAAWKNSALTEKNKSAHS